MLSFNERRKFKIDLVCIFAPDSPGEISIPSGILYVGGALKSAGYKVNVHHITYEEIDEIALLVSENQPIFIGLSVITGLPTSLSAEFSKKVKEKNKNLTVVWGGIHPSLIPEQCLEQDYIDIVVIGEGEETVLELADSLAEGAGLKGVKGIGYKEFDNIIINEPRPFIEDLDGFRIDWSLVEPSRYIQRTSEGERFMSFIASRGCPFNCGFCYNTQFNKRRWRAHSVDFVLKEIGSLKEKYDIACVASCDDNFFVNKERAIRMIEGLRSMNLSLARAELCISDIKDDLIKKLRDLDVGEVFTGWESGNNRLLKLINKGFTVEDIISSVGVLARYPEMHVKGSAIIGLPTETKQEMLNTVSIMLRLGSIHPNINFNMGMYLPYPGTPLYELAIKEGLKPPRDPEGWRYWSMFSRRLPITWLPWLTKRDISDIRNINKYGEIYEARLRTKGESKLKYQVRELFRKIAGYRLEKNFFQFPVELLFLCLLRKINKYISRLKPFKEYLKEPPPSNAGRKAFPKLN